MLNLDSFAEICVVHCCQFYAICSVRQEIIQFEWYIPFVVNELLEYYFPLIVNQAQVASGGVVKPYRKQSPRNRRPDDHYVRPLKAVLGYLR